MLHAHYYDGRSSHLHEVGLLVVGEELTIAGEGLQLRVPLRQVRVTERLGRGPRRIELPDGGYCEVRDLERLDELLALMDHRDGLVDRLQRHWPVAVAAVLVFIGVVLAAYRWALPIAAGITAQHLPAAIGRTLTEQALKALDGSFFQPSALPDQRRRTLEAEFHALRCPDGGCPPSHLEFRVSKALGANALTLPDGTIILLDGLVLAMDNDQQVLAVLAHEMGHAKARHPLQLLLQSSAVAAFWGLYIGDVSSVLTTAPTALVQARYSRSLEQEADDYAASLLRANGLSPALLAEALEKLAASHHDTAGGASYLSSHPATDERIRRLRAQAAG